MDILGRYIDLFTNAADSYGDGSDANAHIHYESMREMMQKLRNHPSRDAALTELLESNSAWASSWAAAELLSTGDNRVAMNVLKQQAKEPGIIGFNAEVILSEFAKGSLRSPFSDT